MNEQSIFLNAVELTDPQQRRKYLDQACGDDPQLRSQVEELLVSHNEASSFLEKPPGTFLQFSIRTILAVTFMFSVVLAIFVPFVRAQPPAYGRYLWGGAVMSTALAVVVLLLMCFRRWRIETRGGTVLLRSKCQNPWLEYLPNIIMIVLFAGFLVYKWIRFGPLIMKIALRDPGEPGFGLIASVGMFTPMMVALVYSVTLTWWRITPRTLEIREHGIGIAGLRFFPWSAILGYQWRDGKRAAILTLWFESPLWNAASKKVAMIPREAREPAQRLLDTKGIQPWRGRS